MEVIVHKKVAFRHFDKLVHMWRMRSYPFNRPDAIVPQSKLPEDLRVDTRLLACF